MSVAMLSGCDSSEPSADDSRPTNAKASVFVIDEQTWNEEAFQDRTAVQLKHISHWLATSEHASGEGEDELASLIREGFTTTPLRPANGSGQSLYNQGGVQVMRWSEWSETKPATTTLTGSEGLLAALKAVKAVWPSDGEPQHIKLKQFGVTPAGDKVITKAYFTAHARGKTAAVQQTGTWLCTWDYVPEGEGEPKLRSIELAKLDEVSTTLSSGRPLLEDVTQSLIGHLPCYQTQLRFGANHWITRIPHLKHRFHHGIAVGDINGDGLEDVYICEPEGMPNLLFLKQPDGSVREAAAEFGLNWLDFSRSALFVDLDNDGDQDFVLSGWNALLIFEHKQNGFELRATIKGIGQLTSICAADYDRDGLLDLYTCRYSGETLDGRPVDPIPHHDATNGGINALLKNNGKFAFDDVTKSTGLSHNNNRWTFAASWEDFDNDGDLDLYVANDYGRNNLYRHDIDAKGNSRFRDVAANAGVEDQSFGMSVAWGDPNRDGNFDVHVSNMFSSAGQRVAFQRNFKRSIDDVDDSHIKAVQYGAMGNSLFQNRGDGTFDYISQQAGVARGLWAWSSPFVDLNNDGWEDILVANGFITGPSTTKDL